MSQPTNIITLLWQELKRRKILTFVIGYVAACFAIIELFLNASVTFSVPEKIIRLLYLLSAIGIFVVIIRPWIYDIFYERVIVETEPLHRGA